MAGLDGRSPHAWLKKGRNPRYGSPGKITPCLWFDNQAAAAAAFYTAMFKNPAIGRITRYGKEGFEIHGRPEGTVMTINARSWGTPHRA
ncbi:MAG TPA: VOC family protein [Thiobacillus sp.]|nr:VOC family protein [Thiobacillus sp.]